MLTPNILFIFPKQETGENTATTQRTPEHKRPRNKLSSKDGGQAAFGRRKKHPRQYWNQHLYMWSIWSKFGSGTSNNHPKISPVAQQYSLGQNKYGAVNLHRHGPAKKRSCKSFETPFIPSKRMKSENVIATNGSLYCRRVGFSFVRSCVRILIVLVIFAIWPRCI